MSAERLIGLVVALLVLVVVVWFLLRLMNQA